MGIAIIFFWISLGLLFFCYLGYGILIFAVNRVKFLLSGAAKKMGNAEEPAVTLVIPAYNEAKILHQKLKNALSIDYPAAKLKFICITDGTTDGSEEIAKQYPVQALHMPERKGKFAAVARAMEFVDTPIVVFSDANTMLNPECVRRMVTHYADPKTGGVAGEKKIIAGASPSALGDAEGLYWEYESLLKKEDARFNTVVGAAGELFSIRSELFQGGNENIILDDFVTSMRVCLQGYRIKYEPMAFAMETPSASLKEEAKRKMRISAGAYQSIGYLSGCLNFFRHPLLTFQYISRLLLRWLLCPLMLLVLLVSNLVIVTNGNGYFFYNYFLYLQLTCYLLAVIGWILIRAEKRAWVLTVPFYFLFMNYCLVRGFIKFLKGEHTVLWERSERKGE